jgi:hypothetical protein
MDEIKRKIEQKLSAPGIVEKIVDGLSNSELNSFYLELFRKQSEKTKPADLLKQFKQSRFSSPAKIDLLDYKEYEIEWLKKARDNGFQLIQLSPLAPLGTCSAVGFVNQNNVVSASRSTEVVSDATNVLALCVADDFNSDKSKRIIKYCTTHRHTRAQSFDNPSFSAHFGAFCMVTGGLDSGSYSFELEQLEEHFQFYFNICSKEFPDSLVVKIYFKNASEDFKTKLVERLKDYSDKLKIREDNADNTNDYYQTVRLKTFVKYKGNEIDLFDMGFVDWTQKLLNNKKHRLLISGCGLELAYKIKSGII